MRTVLAVLLSYLAAAAVAAEPAAEAAWIRAAPPNAHAHAGYLRLRNAGDEPFLLTAARSESFGAIEVHESFERDGIMRMRRRDVIEVPARGAVALQPGGLHLMLFRAQQPLPEGTTVDVVLEFEGGLELPVRFEVRRDGP